MASHPPIKRPKECVPAIVVAVAATVLALGACSDATPPEVCGDVPAVSMCGEGNGYVVTERCTATEEKYQYVRIRDVEPGGLAIDTVALVVPVRGSGSPSFLFPEGVVRYATAGTMSDPDGVLGPPDVFPRGAEDFQGECASDTSPLVALRDGELVLRFARTFSRPDAVWVLEEGWCTRVERAFELELSLGPDGPWVRADQRGGGGIVNLPGQEDCGPHTRVDRRFDGNLREVEATYYLSDGSVAVRVLKTWHDDETLATEQSDLAGDGSFEERTVWDAKGRKTSDRRDSDGDGVDDVSEEYRFNAQGDLVEVVLLVDGTEQRNLWSYTYGDHGKSLTMEHDAEADGTVDRRASWTRDGAGNPLTHDMDDDADGVVDRRTEWEWDSHGRNTWRAWDYDVDGEFDFTQAFTYDAMDRVVREETNGVVTTTTYDGAHVVVIEVDAPPGGPIDNRVVFERDPHSGRVLQRTEWRDAVVVSRETWTVDGQGNVLTHAIDDDGDGHLQEQTTSTWGAHCNVTSSAVDGPAGGVIDVVRTFSYECL